MEESLPALTDPRFAQLDHVQSAIFVLEDAGDGVPRFCAFNRFAREVSKRPLTDYLAKTAVEVYPDGVGETMFARHCEVARSGKGLMYDIQLMLGDQMRMVRTYLRPTICAERGTRLIYGTSSDLSQARSTTEAQVKFDTVASEMEQFIAMAAHDLRTPMRNIAQIAMMLRDGFHDQGDGKLELIDLLDEVSGKSMRLITDVLEHAQATEVTPDASLFNVASLCREIRDVIDPHGRHTFTHSSAKVVTDRQALQIGLRNLVDNAVKYGGRDGLEIDIEVAKGPPGMLNVTLRDNGPGIPEETLKFLNGGTLRTGQGYGLFGVRRMVRARGGTLTAQNRSSGPGAKVSFSLPGDWIGQTQSLGDAIPTAAVWKTAADTARM
ncbi:MAG: ATP-binding protein [Pseudomonadota bacterium]